MNHTPKEQDFTALRIRVSAGRVGSTDTSVGLLNNIHRMSDQSIQNQMYSVMTDCPHREKMGWLEQLHIAIDPIFFGYDLRAYGRHLMKQIVDAQNEQGNVPTTAPQLTVFGAVNPEDVEAVYRHLIRSIRDNGTHWTVGEVGLGPLFRALTLPHAYDYLLNELMAKTDYPSYGYFLEQGATTLPEHWEGYDGNGSLDHIIFDCGDTWIYGLAGMKQSQTSIGWRSIDFEPICVPNVTFASTEYLSVRGRAAAKWERQEKLFVYNVTAPAGSTGSVSLSAPLRSIKLDGGDVEGQLGVHHAKQVGDKTTITIGSGSYFFGITRKDMSFCGT
ncbi:uncharacterized protein MYCFIDRAFT_81125 [Pseudocercospora fijiensis CIRAD86]|uniref:Glycoside hydrolase family 78 protein n=1 Tax=Pseudocercospora fijiensis (strain CIRAD86) TaxID=383855 RepID=M3AQC4_PSEFD|nr:uncharacterized protein MYCFIDRAFT_81125 [Pseudocercospora fijiensis CIRAD86]EME79637.1 hypothetical protein MYCFIDRAFT_81125 [Pseudocercospora fijiensis CIRAD86]